jgi:hypothetical protein
VQVASIENRENIKGTIENFEAIATDGVVEWIMSDNTTANLTKLQLEEIANAYAIRKKEAFSTYSSKCKELEEATTIDDLLAIERID